MYVLVQGNNSHVMDHFVNYCEAICCLDKTVGIVVACRQHRPWHPASNTTIPHCVIYPMIFYMREAIVSFCCGLRSNWGPAIGRIDDH